MPDDRIFKDYRLRFIDHSHYHEVEGKYEIHGVSSNYTIMTGRGEPIMEVHIY